MVIDNCILEIKNAAKEDPKKLYKRRVEERLNFALKNYYADLSSKMNSIENHFENNPEKIMKKLVK